LIHGFSPSDVFTLSFGTLNGHLPLSFRPLNLAQMVYVLDHALRFKSVQQFEEHVARPLLVKQYQPTVSIRYDQHFLKECPVLWVHYALYALIEASLPTMEDPDLVKRCKAFSLLLERQRFAQWNESYLSDYWKESTLNFREAMLKHPEGVSGLAQLSDVLDLGLAPIEAEEALPWPLRYCLSLGILAPWGRLCHYLGVHTALYQRFSNPQFKEVPRALALAHAYFSEAPAPLYPQPIHTLVLVEGMTEEVLLPALLNIAGVYEGVRVQSCGGKTAMLAHYQRIRPWFSGRIRLVLDADATDISRPLQKSLHPQDALYLIPQGAIEDCYELPLFLKVLNQVRQGCLPLTAKDFQAWCAAHKVSKRSRSQVYHRFWVAHGLEGFDKTFLAHRIAEALRQDRHALEKLPKGLFALLDFVLK
jgi:hypothetical protein